MQICQGQAKQTFNQVLGEGQGQGGGEGGGGGGGGGGSCAKLLMFLFFL